MIRKVYSKSNLKSGFTKQNKKNTKVMKVRKGEYGKGEYANID